MQINKLKNNLLKFTSYLKCQEYAVNSINSYRKDISGLLKFLKGTQGELKKEYLIEYKEMLVSKLKPSSINRNIISINKFLKYLELDDFKLKTLKIQEQTTGTNEISEDEFSKLIEAAYKEGHNKVALIMLALACTGIRIGELKFLTIEAVKSGIVVINNKGTIRTVVILKELQQNLLRYCKKKDIQSGIIFTGKFGNPISRSYVASAMKEIAWVGGVDPIKAFPHNLRHYFARRFLDCGNPLPDLADILGHKSIDTTRRYLKTNVEEKRKQLSRLKIIKDWKKITAII